MRRFFNILLIALIFTQCTLESPSKDLEDWKQVRDSKDFWDFAAFIQKHPESVYFDSALTRYFIVQNEQWEEEGASMFCCKRNCAKIELANDGMILFDAEFTSIDSLRNQSFRFILNEHKDFDKPESEAITIPEMGVEGTINRGLFEIYVNNNAPRAILKKAISKISEGIEDYKNQLALQWYGMDYLRLAPRKKAAIDSLNSNRLMFWDFGGDSIPQPPPIPENIEEIIEIIED